MIIENSIFNKVFYIFGPECTIETLGTVPIDDEGQIRPREPLGLYPHHWLCKRLKFHIFPPLPSLSTWLFYILFMIFFCRNKKSFSSAKKAIRDNSCTLEMTDRTRSILAFARLRSFIIRVSKLSLSNTITHALWFFFNNFVQKMVLM